MADRNVRVIKANGAKSVCKLYPKTASQAFDKNSLVDFASGVIDPSVATDVTVFGVLLEEVATTDADYATTGSDGGKLVELIQPGDEVEIDWAGTVPTVGLSYGLTNAYCVDQTDTTNKVITCTKVITNNTTTGRMRGVIKSYFGSNNL